MASSRRRLRRRSARRECELRKKSLEGKIMDQYFVDLNGETAGPFSLAEVKLLLDGGKISPATLYSKPGGATWLPLETIAPLLAAASARVVRPDYVERPVYVTTQRTGKGIKSGMALCVIGMILSVPAAFAYPLIWFVTGACLCGFLFFRIVQWFSHG